MDLPEEYQQNHHPFLTIPSKKLSIYLKDVLDSCDQCKNHQYGQALCERCLVLQDAINRYYFANIPVDYWQLELNNYIGDKTLVKYYESFIEDLNKTYKLGTSLLFCGKHGTGKTFISSLILKRAVERGFSGLYVNLFDIVNLMTASNTEKKEAARNQLTNSDVLILDEFDSRFMSTDNISDLYGRVLEPILRARLQNKLPTIMCSNNVDVTSGFHGALKESISSLLKLVKIVPVLGKDFRVQEKK